MSWLQNERRCSHDAPAFSSWCSGGDAFCSFTCDWSCRSEFCQKPVLSADRRRNALHIGDARNSPPACAPRGDDRSLARPRRCRDAGLLAQSVGRAGSHRGQLIGGAWGCALAANRLRSRLCTRAAAIGADSGSCRRAPCAFAGGPTRGLNDPHSRRDCDLCDGGGAHIARAQPLSQSLRRQ